MRAPSKLREAVRDEKTWPMRRFKYQQVGVGGVFNFERAAAEIVQSFVAKHDGDIHVLKESVARTKHVVGLNDGVGNLGRGPNAETNLGLLAIVDRQALT